MRYITYTLLTHLLTWCRSFLSWRTWREI